MNDDLRHAVRVVREYRDDDEYMSRLSGVLSITAIVMLLITNITIANWNTINAAPQAGSSPSSFPQQPAGVAPNCERSAR